MKSEERRAVNKLKVLFNGCCGNPKKVLEYTANMLERENLGRLSYTSGEVIYISKCGESVKVAEINLNDYRKSDSRKSTEKPQ